MPNVYWPYYAGMIKRWMKIAAYTAMFALAVLAITVCIRLAWQSSELKVISCKSTQDGDTLTTTCAIGTHEQVKAFDKLTPRLRFEMPLFPWLNRSKDKDDIDIDPDDSDKRSAL